MDRKEENLRARLFVESWAILGENFLDLTDVEILLRVIRVSLGKTNELIHFIQYSECLFQDNSSSFRSAFRRAASLRMTCLISVALANSSCAICTKNSEIASAI